MEYKRHAAHQLRLIHLPDIHSADAHTSLTHIPKTGNEPCYGCLSAARRPNECHRLPLGNGEAEVADGILFRAVVSERDVLKTNVAGLWHPGRAALGQRSSIGEFLQSVHRLIGKE